MNQTEFNFFKSMRNFNKNDYKSALCKALISIFSIIEGKFALRFVALRFLNKYCMKVSRVEKSSSSVA